MQNEKKLQKILTDTLYDFHYNNNIQFIKDNDNNINIMSGFDISRCDT